MPNKPKQRQARKTVRPSQTLQSAMETERIAALVGDSFCRGFSPTEIPKLLERKYGLKLTREAPYRYLNYCTSRGFLRFVPPADAVLADEVQRRFGLHRVEICRATPTSGVMERAAELVMDLIRSLTHTNPEKKKSIRIGCAGGYSMALLMRRLVEKLSQPQVLLPKEIICQNLVAGFDLEDPRTNPIGFLSEAVGSKPSGVEIKCQLFQAPALVEIGQRDQLLGLEGNNIAATQVRQCDIILTSCGGIDDPHQMLVKYYRGNDTIATLKSLRCQGDMLWLPVCEDGPLRFEDLSEEHKKLIAYRTMSLIELTALPELIKKGTAVVLAVGPCAGCLLDHPPTKGGILRTILKQPTALISHLVTTSELANCGLKE